MMLAFCRADAVVRPMTAIVYAQNLALLSAGAIFHYDPCIRVCRYRCFCKIPIVFTIIRAFLIADTGVLGMFLAFVSADSSFVTMIPVAFNMILSLLSADSVAL